MRAKTLTFLFIALFITGLLPAFNITQRLIIEGNFKNMGWKKFSWLYSMDRFLPYFGKIAYRNHISIAPQNVFIGKDKWLFLGDNYNQSITSKREGMTADRMAKLDRNLEALDRWDQWLKEQGVKEFRYMIAPDKESAYPEYLPDWVAPAPNQLSGALRDKANKRLYVDLFARIQAAKTHERLYLYYKADTHWNSLGAWNAFTALGESLKGEQVIIWPSPALGEVASVYTRSGFDLANFLHVGDDITDTEIVLRFSEAQSLQKRRSYFDNGEPLAPNAPLMANFIHRPVMDTTVNALNKKCVLWLHDSFGEAMTPFMSATFSEVLHAYPGSLDAEQLQKLVVALKPDYVVITNVERDFLARDVFRTPPAERSQKTANR